jgi:hypothetical protein
MKRTYLAVFAIFSIAVIIAISCKKNANNNGTAIPISQLFAGLKTAPQNFTVTAGQSQTIIGSDSTVINFYPYSFKDKNGNIITSGTVDIQLIEMYKPGDMIANQTSTTAAGQLLQSGGQVNITATINGEEVFANKYGIAFKQKSQSNAQMQLFYGNNPGADSITTWSISDTTKNGTKSYCISKGDTTHNPYADTSYHYRYWPDLYYIFDSCTSFNGMVNCDRFNGDLPFWSTIAINFSDNSFLSPYNALLIYIVYPTLNCTQSFNGGHNSSGTSTTGSYQLPQGRNIDIVIVAYKDGTYYYYQQTDIPVAATITVNAAMAADTRGDIVSRLQGL